ncbi:preprotein translocase subunit SecD [Halorientalis halophila]|uniref:preprotein translocase subunit SecD n=1 Tax=Halorientalis halophila TaxID=3108499 RepID=UPI00300B5034
MNVRENWRIALLVIFTIASAAVLFGPFVAATATGGDEVKPVNLNYGLDLSGGTQIRAPLIGMTAEEVEYTQETDLTEAQQGIAEDLGVPQSDVQLRLPQQQGQQQQTQALGTAEVFSKNVTRAEFASALQNNGFDVSEDQIRDGVTAQTRETVVNVLNDKINEGGITGGTVKTAAAGNNYFVIVEVPNADRSEVVNLISGSGQVSIDAHYPVRENGTTTYQRETLLTNEDFTNVGAAEQADQGTNQPHVSVSLTEEAAPRYSQALQEFGFTAEGVGSCPPNADQDPDNATGHCLYTVQNGEVVYAASMSQDLATTMNNGEFASNPSFVMTTGNYSEAQQLSVNLRAGTVPAELDLDNGTTYTLLPSVADRFKLFSLLAGLMAWLAVSGVVFVRYGSPRVAVPMLGTAAAEVFLLLGFASTIGLALDLSHIAGFIAVIGTGVDDLIIIADEILQEGKVATGKVFQSRFRKAFWVIGAAAATTIIAMSPLTLLSLGDLTGFAIVTIVGVLLGVLVTRPAYGDILRNLMLSAEERERFREE